jgi:hypothetical protein
MLTVITAAFYEDSSKIRYLQQSCEQNRLTLKVYGLGAPYNGHVDAKITELLRALVDVKTEYVMYCDGVDSVVLAEEDEILQAYEDVRDGKDLVFGADMKCFPYEELAVVFKKRGRGAPALSHKWKGTTRHRIYMNAGVFMGKTEYVKKQLTKLYTLYQKSRHNVAHPEDDQGWWCLGLQKGLVDFAIDYKAELVIMTKYTPDSWYALTPGKCRLTNGSTPCVMHFAGIHDTTKRMPDFYRRLFPNG